MNQEEAKELTGENKPENAAKILINTEPEITIVKKGADGVFAMTSDTMFSVSTYPVKVVDSVEFAKVTADLKSQRWV